MATATLIGADGTWDEVVVSQLWSFGLEPEVVRDGDLIPTVGSGTREAVIATGWVRATSGLGKLGSGTSISLAANGGGVARLDYVVAEFNWTAATSPRGVPANSVGIVAVQGPTSGAVPSLVRTPGNIWQVPLGLYRIPTGGGAITVLDVRPRRPRSIPYSAAIAATNVSQSGNNVQVATLTIPPPGFTHRIQGAASLKMSDRASGGGFCFAAVHLNGSLLVNGRTTKGNYGPAPVCPKASAELPGYQESVLTLLVTPSGMDSGDGTLSTVPGTSDLVGLVLPA